MWLGLDLGTTAVKATLIQTPSSDVVTETDSTILGYHQESVETPTFSSSSLYLQEESCLNVTDNEFVCHEMDSNIIWKAVQSCLAELDQNKPSGACSNVAICGQMHGVILWNEDVELRRDDSEYYIFGTFSKLITWQDGRCHPKFIDSLPESEYKPHAGFGAATLSWMSRYQSRYLKSFKYAGTIMDFISTLLCGRSEPLMSPQNAFSWGYFNPLQNTWEKDRLAEAVVCRLPSIVEVGTRIGTVQHQISCVESAAQVYVGLGDAQCSFAAVNRRDDSGVFNIGTSAQLSFLHKVSPEDPEPTYGGLPYQIWPYLPAKHLAVTASMNGGNALSEFVNMVQCWMTSLGMAISHDQIWTRLTQLNSINDSPTARETLPVVVPTYLQERTTLSSKKPAGAQISGLTSTNTSLHHLYIAYCDGIIDNVITLLNPRVLKERGITDIVCTGGGFEKHPRLRDRVEERYGLKARLASSIHASYGAVSLSITAL